MPKRARLARFDVNIKGQRAETEPARYTALEIEYVLAGENIKPKGVEQAITLSEEKYCSALASCVQYGSRANSPANAVCDTRITQQR